MAADEDVAGEASTRVSRWMQRPRLVRTARVLGFAAGGAVLAVLLGGRVRAEIGPFETTVAARPAVAGDTTVHLAPLGTIGFDTHDAPVALDLRVDELQVDQAERIAQDPALLETLEDDIAADSRGAMWSLALRATLVATAGGAAGALLAWPCWRSLVAGAGLGGLMAFGVGGAAAVTFDPDAVARPRYSGLLTVAPTAVGNVEKIVARFGEYRAQLTELVGNVVTLYQAAQGLPTFEGSDDTIRVLHVSDIHLNPQAFDLIRQLVDQFDIDAVADTGDITDWGTEPEARLLEEIGRLEVPYVWVRGNHDSTATQTDVAAQPRAVVLDGAGADVAGLRFFGIGDPRYTPDKDQPSGRNVERAQADAFAPQVARLLRAERRRPDVVLVHDPRAARRLGGQVPLVLAGHTHKVREASVGATVLLVEGTTGGGGLRALQDEEPHPLTSSVLYFTPEDRRLVAYDRITVRGLGRTGTQIERHIPTGITKTDEPPS